MVSGFEKASFSCAHMKVVIERLYLISTLFVTKALQNGYFPSGSECRFNRAVRRG